MSTLYIEFSSPADAAAFMDETPGFQYIEAGALTDAIFGDTRIDAGEDGEFWGPKRVAPRMRIDAVPSHA